VIYLILGTVLLAALLLAGQWFVNAEPKKLLHSLKWVAYGAGGLFILFFVLTGRFMMLFWLLPVLLPWLMRARAAARTAKNFSRMASGGSSGMGSEVSSEFLEMHLDHDSGDMDGVIRKGLHNGKYLSALSMDDLVDLYETYAIQDVESARLLGAYLDRTHAEWRGNTSQSSYHNEEPENRSSGSMDRAEAFRVLGLEDDADEAAIKAAHHRLIAELHPDRGGSAYLASKINEARDVLLKS